MSAVKPPGSAAAEVLQQKIEEQVLRALEEKEAQLDAALEQAAAIEARNREGNRLDDEDLEELRARRKKELQMQQMLRGKMRSAGHGELQELHDEKEFFDAAKKSPKMVSIFPKNKRPYLDKNKTNGGFVQDRVKQVER